MKSCLLLHSYNYYRPVCHFTLAERRRTMVLRGQQSQGRGILVSRNMWFSVAVVTSSRQTTDKGGENDTVKLFFYYVSQS